MARLDGFLDKLPAGPQYAVEIRNPEYLGPEYFATLKAQNVAHLFNAWARMPTIGDQIDMAGAFTADFLVARAWLKKGRNYEDAVQTFEPYKQIQEPNPPLRKALVPLAHHALERKKPAFLLINNRAEENAPGTIEAVVDGL